MYSCPGNFYPRSPCGERQRTPLNSPTLCYFYPRSPCGERRLLHGSESKGIKISIHALLAESDISFNIFLYLTTKFLSTLSLRRATRGGGFLSFVLSYFYPRSPCGERHGRFQTRCRSIRISIHALLAESDHAKNNDKRRSQQFLSTLSLRRATV